MKITFLGTHGWYPKYGHTPCVLVQTGKADVVFDLGTGAAKLKDYLRLGQGIETHVFLTHYHLDHAVGLSFLLGVFRGKKMTIWGQKGVEAAVKGLLSQPYFPFGIEKWPFTIEFKEVEEGRRLVIADFEMIGMQLEHSNAAMGYRMEHAGKALAYVTDTRRCANAVELGRGVDLLMHEATYTEANKIGNSHSTGRDAGKTASEAKAKKLALFHLDAECDEAGAQEILDEAVKEFRNTVVAKDGMVIEL